MGGLEDRISLSHYFGINYSDVHDNTFTNTNNGANSSSLAGISGTFTNTEAAAGG